MADSTTQTVLWPDLSRYGARLTVAYNPTAGLNFLKFTVLDRQLYATTCGLSQRADIVQVMRDAGFAYAAGEITSMSHRAYDYAIKRGVSDAGAEEASREALSKVYFYSASLLIKKELIQQFVPALTEADFKQMPIAEVKHLDHGYLSPFQSKLLITQHQTFDGAERGVFYTTPGDRRIVKEADASKVTLNELLEYRDFPPARVVQREALAGAMNEYAKFNSLPIVERLTVGQTLTPGGLPLKAPRPNASFIGYAAKADAIAANGGIEEGVEEAKFEYGIPIAFEYPGKRLLILKDARFLEIPNSNRLQGEEAVADNVSRHWEFLSQMERLQSLYETAKSNGYLDQENWNDPTFFKQADDHFAQVYETMFSARTSASENQNRDLLDHTDLIIRSGLRPTHFEKAYSKDFLNFLGVFKNTLSPALLTKKAANITQAAVEKGVQSARRAVKAKDVDAFVADRREDAGEKIGGARKDYAKNHLSSSEIDSLTVREMSELVTKDNVWPPLDYAEMRSNGVEPAVAWIVREMRKTLPVNPLRGGYNIFRTNVQLRMSKDVTPEQCRNFVNAVTIVRDSIGNAKTTLDLKKGIHRIRELGEMRISINNSAGQREMLNNRESSGDPFPDGAGYKFAMRLLPEIGVINGVIESYEFERMKLVAQAKTKGGWEWAIKDKPSNDDELGEDAEGTAEGKKEKTERPEPVVPHLENIQRDGPDYRSGKDVDEALLMEVFGFRAVEYGNWLPQNERQVVLNHAYDAFMDLADVLGLPPKAMSLGGDLAVAFGSRGTGGKSAAMAHYEPGRNVINLTRLKGAGTLAHEWGHAFDYWLAKVTELSSTRPVSEMLKNRSKSNNNLLHTFNSIIAESKTKFRTKEEVVAEWTKAGGKKLTTGKDRSLTEHAETCMRNWIIQLDNCLPEDKRNGVFREYALKALEDRFVDDAELSQYGVKPLERVDDLARDLRDAIDLQAGPECRKRVDFNYPGKVGSWYNTRLNHFKRQLAAFEVNSVRGPSIFLQDAEYYDSYRSKPYWSTEVELFARAFESWVVDRVEQDRGNKSQYLVFGRGDNPDAEHSGYPRGEERKRVAEKMAEFLNECRPEIVRMMGLVDVNKEAVLSNKAEVPM